MVCRRGEMEMGTRQLARGGRCRRPWPRPRHTSSRAVIRSLTDHYFLIPNIPLFSTGHRRHHREPPDTYADQPLLGPGHGFKRPGQEGRVQVVQVQILIIVKTPHFTVPEFRRTNVLRFSSGNINICCVENIACFILP